MSEGRDAAAIAAIAAALSRSARLLDAHSDADHHRSVFTLVAEPDELVVSLASGITRTRELVDLRHHEGVHPRVGAADVVPVVPIDPDAMADAHATALDVAELTGRELGLPVFLYGEVGGGRRPAFFRRGGLSELTRRMSSGELVPDFGPLEPDPRSGVVLVGARRPLVAYNVDLSPGDLDVARAIAVAIRESSGGMPGVQAIGLELPRSRRIQVSMNVLDLERSPLHEVVERVRSEAVARQAEVAGGELVGLVPERVLAEARAAGVVLPGVDDAHVLEHRLGL
jgi:glutamate formiminotransferase/glutamate formiminotransferase/formiminotetrahydrofolate cyclodeaminase